MMSPTSAIDAGSISQFSEGPDEYPTDLSDVEGQPFFQIAA
jgi:hypothetical protein